jgi:polyisoprenoid-binding protein YceI
MRRIVFGVLIAAAAVPAAAEPETFTIDPNHTFPSFEVSHMGISVQRGRFNKTSGRITIDTSARAGSGEILIDATTIDTGHPKLGEHLRSADFFNVAKYPTIAFKATGFRFDADKVKSVTGDLTILGVSRPATLDAVTYNCAPHPLTKKKVCGGDFVATIKRSDYGMTKGIPAVSDEVTLRINVEAIKD